MGGRSSGGWGRRIKVGSYASWVRSHHTPYSASLTRARALDISRGRVCWLPAITQLMRCCCVCQTHCLPLPLALPLSEGSQRHRPLTRPCHVGCTACTLRHRHPHPPQPLRAARGRRPRTHAPHHDGRSVILSHEGEQVLLHNLVPNWNCNYSLKESSARGE